MRNQNGERKPFTHYGTQLPDADEFVAHNVLKAAFLLGGTALSIHFGVTNFRNDAISGPTLATVQDLPAKQTENKRLEFRLQHDFSQRYGKGAVCRTKVQTLARRYFSSNDQLKKSVAARLAKTYRIAPRDAGKIVRTAAKISKDYDIDPFLVLGIIAKESSFNPNARSRYGATGLMQVHAPSHQDILKKMGLNTNNPRMTEKSLRSQIQVNVTAGVQIYKQYEKQYGSRVKALQAYNGTPNDTTLKYARKVLALQDRFSAQAAAPISCGKSEYAFMGHGKQAPDLTQKRDPA